MENYDAVVTVTENAFMGLCTGSMNPSYACGTGGVTVTGEKAYQMLVVGLSVSELLYGVLQE